MGGKYLFLFFVVVYSLSFVNAADLGYSNPTLPKLTSTTPVTVTGSVNYSSVNTNNSQYLEGINSSGFWQTGNNQNVGAGTKTGSYDINTTGNITSGNSTHFSKLAKGTITNTYIENREVSTQNIGNTLTHNGVFLDGGTGGFTDAGITNVLTNNVNYTGNTMSPITVNTKGISNGVYVQGSHTVNGEELNFNEENSGMSNTVFRTGTQSGYTYLINNYGISNTVAGQTKTTTGAVVTENNYGGHFTVTASLANNALGSLTKNNYGFYGIALGTTQNQVSTCYGAYVSSSGCDTNYGYYSATNSPNYFGGNVTVVQDIEGRRNLNITGNSTLTGNNRIGSRNENTHAINNVISENSMLFTAFTYTRFDSGAYGINNNIAFNQNITNAMASVFGINNVITLRGINNRSASPRSKRAYGVYNSITDSMTLNGGGAQSTLYGTYNELIDNTNKTNLVAIDHYAVYNTDSSNLNTTGYTNKYGTSNAVFGTADTNYGTYNTVQGATYNWAVYNEYGDTYAGPNNVKTYFGTALSSSINYNGTDLLINPKELGSGKVVVQGDLAQSTGNSTINNYYAEMYCKNDTGCGVIDLVTSDVYVAMANQTAGNMNGFNLTAGTNLTARVGGMYQINAKVSVTGGAPAGEYGMKVFINEVGQNNCYDHFHVGSTQISMVISCIARVNANDKVSVRFDDHASPVTDLTFYASNLNLVRIAN